MTVGLLPTTSGEIRLKEKSLSSWSAQERAQLIQMVVQDPFSSLDPRQTVGASIAEPIRLAARAEGHPLSQKALRERVQDFGTGGASSRANGPVSS
jgi:ABC-type antimicrobial peptide transport system ATPase subunit